MVKKNVINWFNGSKEGGYTEAEIGDGLKIYPNPARYNSGGTVQKGATNAINTYLGGGSATVTEDLRIRYLTPRECLRLMSFSDEQIDRLIEAVPSKNKLYKLAGNSIVVSCLEAIFKGIYIDKTFNGVNSRQLSLFNYKATISNNRRVEEGPIRIIELFAGIGAQKQALDNLNIPNRSIGISEIEESAIIGYAALHGETDNLGDIRAIHHLPDCDLITYSFPCQDLSVAGNKAGMSEGSLTRSSLLWEVGRLLKDMRERDRAPEVLLMENVDAILNKKNIAQFKKWIVTLGELGYTSSYQILNAKDYGVPQNRKRCFMVSTLNKGKFKFPAGRPLDRRLIDLLEKDVSEDYYLKPDQIERLEAHRIKCETKGLGFGWRPLDPERERAGSITTKARRNGTSNYIMVKKEVE